ncbi:MAG: anti-sigma F factor [Peptococcaceae bacterium]|jgi:stage II sporulation protein AB (anti-sigma F factor)|nr:anti-sigma F factor [Peptococcaceae bacterium]
MNPNQIELSFSSRAENLSAARMVIASVGSQADLMLNDIEDLKVGVSEAVTNAIVHGYQNDPDGVVALMIQSDEDKIQIIVRDQGCGIADIELAMQPSFSSDPERMGLGFVFMKSFMDELTVDSQLNEGTTVTLVKYLQHPPSSH